MVTLFGEQLETTRSLHLQGFHEEGHVDLRDAQWEAKHGRDHDEADDEVQPYP